MTDHIKAEFSADTFRAALRHLASGVSLITTKDADGAPMGMLATAVSSVTAEPPTILICINHTATMHAALMESRIFCVNFLALANDNVAQRFTGSVPREARFDEGQWETLASGAPVLGNAHASLDCEISQITEMGSHSVIFGKVLAAKVAPSEASQPLVFHNRAYGSFTAL